jgi:hypothetical protein
MLRRHRTKLICGEIARAREKSKIVRRDPMMQVCLLGADRAVALACASHFCTDFEPDSAAVTAPYVRLSVHNVPPLIALREILFIDSNYDMPKSIILNDIFLSVR